MLSDSPGKPTQTNETMVPNPYTSVFISDSGVTRVESFMMYAHQTESIAYTPCIGA